MENIPGTPLRPDGMLCGEMFGLDVRRHRWFETEPSAFGLIPSCMHDRKVVSVHGRPGGTSTRDGRLPQLAEWKTAMGIDWMSGRELSQAIPRAYTQHVGEWLLSAIGAAA
jgi:DNA (cytosine-5)-methyltransferase 1